MISRRGAPLAHGSSDGPVVVEAAPGVIDTWEVVLLALHLLQPGRALDSSEENGFTDMNRV